MTLLPLPQQIPSGIPTGIPQQPVPFPPQAQPKVRLGDLLRNPAAQAFMTQLGISLLAGRGFGNALGDAGAAIQRLQQLNLQRQQFQTQQQRTQEEILSERAQREIARKRLGLEERQVEQRGQLGKRELDLRERSLGLRDRELQLRQAQLQLQAQQAMSEGNTELALKLLNEAIGLQRQREKIAADMSVFNPNLDPFSAAGPLANTSQEVVSNFRNILGSLIQGQVPAGAQPPVSTSPLTTPTPSGINNVGRAGSATFPSPTNGATSSLAPSSVVPTGTSPASSSQAKAQAKPQKKLQSKTQAKKIQQAELEGAVKGTVDRVMQAQGIEGLRRLQARVQELELSPEAKKLMMREIRRRLQPNSAPSSIPESVRKIGSRPGFL